ncbi:hypothetical protein [Streptosporangium sp. NPDC001681]|uniref:hypothetical protein n=1 Tax=Streptosporangium sp. NPDC001681 TaxID=3154395 RepID=UPI00331CB163
MGRSPSFEPVRAACGPTTRARSPDSWGRTGSAGGALPCSSSCCWWWAGSCSRRICWDDDKKSLIDREVKLTGFVSPARKKGQWYVTRMQIACCAADAFPPKIAVKGLRAPPTDT